MCIECVIILSPAHRDTPPLRVAWQHRGVFHHPECLLTSLLYTALHNRKLTAVAKTCLTFQRVSFLNIVFDLLRRSDERTYIIPYRVYRVSILIYMKKNPIAVFPKRGL